MADKIIPYAQRYRRVIDMRKVAASSVPYGESISTNGRFVYAAYLGERLVCVAATASEARRRFGQIIKEESRTLRKEGRGGSNLNNVF
jgi:hypothetical protein